MFFVSWIFEWILRYIYTPKKTNMSPKNGLLQQKIHVPIIDFQENELLGFREGISPSISWWYKSPRAEAIGGRCRQMPSNSFRILATSKKSEIWRIRWISKPINKQIQSWSLLSKERDSKIYNKSLPHHILSRRGVSRGNSERHGLHWRKPLSCHTGECCKQDRHTLGQRTDGTPKEWRF